jgi:hypothetical protein
VQRFATGPVIVVLALFAVYTTYITISAIVTAEGYEPVVFWPSIALLSVIAAAAAFAAFKLYRIRLSKPHGL